MHACIMVTGVPGVGKTSLTSHVRILDAGVSVKNFGQVMFEIGKRKKVIRNLDELETINVQKRARLQTEAVKIIRDEITSLPVIIDGHLIVDTRSGFVPGLPLRCVSALKLNAIVLLAASAEEIVKRRNNNPTKYAFYRNDEERISLHEQVLFQDCLQYALLSHATFEVLRNPQDKLDDTAVALVNFLVELIPEFVKK